MYGDYAFPFDMYDIHTTYICSCQMTWCFQFIVSSIFLNNGCLHPESIIDTVIFDYP